MDPAALGTAMIGLGSVRVDEARYQRAEAPDPRPSTRVRPTRRLRLALADVLRRTARRIEPAPAPGG